MHFDRDDLSTTLTPFGRIVRLDGTEGSGTPGVPALPLRHVKVAVPVGYWPHSLEVSGEKWATVVDGGAMVAPAQRPRLAYGTRTVEAHPDTGGAPFGGVEADTPEHDGHDRAHCAADCPCRREQHRPSDIDGPDPFPAPEVVAPDPEAYEAHVTDPPPLARAVSIESIGDLNVAVVEIAPVRMGSVGELSLCTEAKLEVRYAAEPPLGNHDEAVAHFREVLGRDINPERVIVRPALLLTGKAEAERLRDVALGDVLNPRLIDRRQPDGLVVRLHCEYLIVTDDHCWDPVTITPTTARPGLIAQFERLAQAKRSRGISARLVTITDIVAGRYGDVRTGARDLQEVIRKFLKIARSRWGVQWLLLGGDTTIVPIRRVAGAMEGHVGPGTENPPDANRSFWTGTQLHMHVVNPGTWWAASVDNLLVRPDTGALIPYDAAGTSSATSPGWFFTTSSTYATRSAVATEFVCVNGPGALVNTRLQFLYAWNQLPTDLYYASLDSWVIRTRRVSPFSFDLPYVLRPEHDWDAIGNGIYGQFREDGTDLDGVIARVDLSVGRAPVDTDTDAQTFVDKVLRYEGLSGGVWSSTLANWPRRALLAASDWGGEWFRQTGGATPSAGQYIHDVGRSAAVLRRATIGSFDLDLVAHISDTNRREMPFKFDTDPAVRGWYYARSATDHRRSGMTVPLFGSTFFFPLPSEWVVVHGPTPERTPASFEMDPRAQDGSLADQERLRIQLGNELPGINRFQRLYEDLLDLTFFQRLAAPADYLTTASMRAALDSGPHFVSLSGHGSGNGCCAATVAMAKSLTNTAHFIGYADSCLTNELDMRFGDAFSEELLKNPNGGAVAYVGNTRFSWISVGDDFQRAFFHRLVSTRHLGTCNDSRVSVSGTGFLAGYERWQMFTLNLLGDPELRVYRGPVRTLSVRIEPWDFGRFKVDVVAAPPPVGPPRPGPVEGALVQVRQGDVVVEGLTDDTGAASFAHQLFTATPVEITVSHPEFAAERLDTDLPSPPACRCTCET
ncbi:C25 family cysteine peptidase [Mycobacterium sp. AMU20-3851]|uniref:C25 family cysteine peptidase n=1 Tax=Mycobacterium sp. AMU20-3851 TaxID=3122055 RepID=UPI0037545C61